MKKILKSVQGNKLVLAIQLQAKTVTPEGRVSEPYIPAEDDDVKVTLHSTYGHYPIQNTVHEDILLATDNGTLPVGRYDVEICITKADGTPLRSMWCNLVEITFSNDGVLEEWDDFVGPGAQSLDAAVFFFAKGEKGSTDYNELENKPEFEDQDNPIRLGVGNVVYMADLNGNKILKISQSLSENKFYIPSNKAVMDHLASNYYTKGQTQEYIDSIIYYLGDFTDAESGNSVAANAEFAGKEVKKLLWYRVANGMVGVIENYPSQMYCTQILHLNTYTYVRVLNFTDDTRTEVSAVGEWNEMKLPSKAEWQAVLNDISSALNGVSTLTSRVSANTASILGMSIKIPSQASVQNQLADKEFVNASIATATEEFNGIVCYLGEFSMSGGGEAAAAQAVNAGDEKKKLLYYKVSGGRVGIIENYPSSAYCSQVLHLDTKSYARVINFTDGTRGTVSVVGGWNEMKVLAKSEWDALVDRVATLESSS